MRYYLYKGRHVVRAVDEEQDGKVRVAWVALSNGAERRGRLPKLATPVRVTDLEEVEWTETPQTEEHQEV